MPNPYKPNPGRPQPNSELDEFVNSAVRFGTGLGSSILDTISDALNTVGSTPASRTPQDDFNRWRRRLDNRLSGGFGGWMTMGVFGWIFSGSFGIAALVMWILGAVAAGPDAAALAGSPELVFRVLAPVFTALTLGFGVMGYAGCRRANYMGRLRRYLRCARGFTVPLNDLARDNASSTAKVKKDLQKAVADGHYPDARLDVKGETLYLDGTLYKAPAAPAPAPTPTAAPAAKTDAEQFSADGVAFLKYLRDCRGHLGENADAELVTMQKTCGAILGFIHNHPEQLPRVRRFRDYYLPTTRKLLDTAQGLGEAEADNAQVIRRDITGILHTLNQAYLKLYDTLLQDVSLDVSTEIDTLEAMLRQDGLTHDFKSDFGVK